MIDGREDTAQARKYYHHIINGGTLSARDVGQMVEYLEAKDDEITRLRADLAAAREQVAGAYLAAANVIDAKEEASSTKTNKRFLLDRSFGNLTATAYAPAILALTPADATAALEARDERVRAEERARVIEEAKSLGSTSINLGGMARSLAHFVNPCCHEAFKRGCFEYAEKIDTLHTEASREVK